MTPTELGEQIASAAQELARSDGLLIGAGAGMGVDSGLPDFRGGEGFWKAYPALRAQQLNFVDMANPSWFRRDPARAWGFYGHRLQLYRQTVPHKGFAALMKIAESLEEGAFVFTSNVDGHFQKAGVDSERVVECHGSIHHLQCSGSCREIWSAEDLDLEVDAAELRALGSLPSCPRCGAVARPNILMFQDHAWIDQRTARQERALRLWLQRMESKRLAVIECGAGIVIPTVRWTCERLAKRLIRVNPHEPRVPPGHIGLAAGAEHALVGIEAARASL